MISEALLYRFIAVACILVAVALGWIFLHAVALRERARRRERSNAEAFELLRTHLTRSAPGLDTAAVRDLDRRNTSTLIHVFVSLAATLHESDLQRLRAYAEQLQLTARTTRLLRHGSWAGKLHAARLVTILGVPPTEEAARLFHASRAELRAQAAEWIAVAPTPALIDVLIDSLGAPERLAHYAVHDALVRSRGITVDRLSAWLRSKHEISAVREALQVASRIAAPDFLHAAMRNSHDPDDSLRAAAANLLGAIGGELAAGRLVELLGDRHPSVRATAAARLGTLNVVTAAPRIGELLRDEDFDVRRAAALALRRFDSLGSLILRSYATDSFQPAAAIAQHVLDLPFTGSAA